MPRRAKSFVRQKDFSFADDHPFNEVKNYNPMTATLKPLTEMYFDEFLEQAFPYQPLPELFLCHLEIKFTYYRMFQLEKKMPSLKEIVKRYWRRRYLIFVKNEFESMGIPIRVYRKEDKFCHDYPDLWDKWQKQKSKYLTQEMKRANFGTTETDFAHYLQLKWLEQKKREFLERNTGLREEKFWRQYTRSISLNIMSNWILGCKHWECWKIRITHFPFNIFMWLKFVFYWRFHPEVYYVH